MDILQLALVFLIMLLAVFLTVTGVQVFLILRDLKKALDKINNMAESGAKMVKEVEKPVVAAAQAVSAVEDGVAAVAEAVRKPHKKTAQRRFYKKFLK